MLSRTVIMTLVVGILLSALPAMALNMSGAPDVVAEVNGEKITKQALGDVLFDWNAVMVLEELIDQRIVGQEARKAGIVITADQIKAKIEEIKTRIPPGQTFDEALKGIGMTPGHFFARVKFDLQMREIVKRQVKVTDDDLAGFIKASHILVRIPYTADEAEKAKKEEEAKAKIEKIAAEIKAGKPFADAAKEYSDDTANKEKGGDLGFFGKQYMAKEFEDAAFALKAGDISEPVKTSFGYHLINVTALGKDATGDERKELMDRITEQRYAEKWQDWLLGVKNAAKVDNKLSPKKPEPAAGPTAPPPAGPPPPPAGPAPAPAK